MLHGEDFRRRHERALHSALYGIVDRGGRNDRLARTDVALQEPVHRRILRHIRRDRFNGAALRVCQPERQFFDETRRLVRLHAEACACAVPAAQKAHTQRQRQQLLKHQPPPRM